MECLSMLPSEVLFYSFHYFPCPCSNCENYQKVFGKKQDIYVPLELECEENCSPLEQHFSSETMVKEEKNWDANRRSIAEPSTNSSAFGIGTHPTSAKGNQSHNLYRSYLAGSEKDKYGAMSRVNTVANLHPPPPSANSTYYKDVHLNLIDTIVSPFHNISGSFSRLIPRDQESEITKMTMSPVRTNPQSTKKKPQESENNSNKPKPLNHELKKETNFPNCEGCSSATSSTETSKIQNSNGKIFNLSDVEKEKSETKKNNSNTKRHHHKNKNQKELKDKSSNTTKQHKHQKEELPGSVKQKTKKKPLEKEISERIISKSNKINYKHISGTHNVNAFHLQSSGKKSEISLLFSPSTFDKSKDASQIHEIHPTAPKIPNLGVSPSPFLPINQNNPGFITKEDSQNTLKNFTKIDLRDKLTKRKIYMKKCLFCKRKELMKVMQKDDKQNDKKKETVILDIRDKCFQEEGFLPKCALLNIDSTNPIEHIAKLSQDYLPKDKNGMQIITIGLSSDKIALLSKELSLLNTQNEWMMKQWALSLINSKKKPYVCTVHEGFEGIHNYLLELVCKSHEMKDHLETTVSNFLAGHQRNPNLCFYCSPQNYISKAPSFASSMGTKMLEGVKGLFGFAENKLKKFLSPKPMLHSQMTYQNLHSNRREVKEEGNFGKTLNIIKQNNRSSSIQNMERHYKFQDRIILKSKGAENFRPQLDHNLFHTKTIVSTDSLYPKLLSADSKYEIREKCCEGPSFLSQFEKVGDNSKSSKNENLEQEYQESEEEKHPQVMKLNNNRSKYLHEPNTASYEKLKSKLYKTTSVSPLIPQPINYEKAISKRSVEDTPKEEMLTLLNFKKGGIPQPIAKIHSNLINQKNNKKIISLNHQNFDDNFSKARKAIGPNPLIGNQPSFLKKSKQAPVKCSKKDGIVFTSCLKKIPNKNPIYYYYANGISSPFKILKNIFEDFTTEKDVIKFDCQRILGPIPMNLGRNENNTSHQEPKTNPCQLIITKDSIITILTNSNFEALNNSMHSFINSSISSIDERDFMEFDEASFADEHFVIESRFMIKDILKITSKKQNAQIITFYYGINLFEEYDVQHEERTIFESSKFPEFALKKKKFKKVDLSFLFPSKEEAKICINKTSLLYKDLKAKRNVTEQ